MSESTPTLPEQRHGPGDAEDVGRAVVAAEVEGLRRLLVGDEHRAPASLRRLEVQPERDAAGSSATCEAVGRG